MDKIRIRKLISSLAKRDYRRMYMNDFFLTWEKTDDEIAATFLVAEILRGLREANISCRMFDSGLGISLFRDNSTRTRFSFASACNLLGLEVQHYIDISGLDSYDKFYQEHISCRWEWEYLRENIREETPQPRQGKLSPDIASTLPKLWKKRLAWDAEQRKRPPYRGEER